MNRLKKFLSELPASFWFTPALIICGAGALAAAMIELDSRVARDVLVKWPRLFGAGADGSRMMLSAVASSMITLAGVVFSITIVALSLASSQYSPRILRNFMQDRNNQVVLGVFVGVFVYCLIVLRTISGGEEGRFVPSVSVLLGVVLALVGVCFLIFFIHHIAISIQATNIIAVATRETLKAVEKLFPEELGHGADEENARPPDYLRGDTTWRAVAATEAGYIQSVDAGALLRLAGEHKTVLRMEYGIGEYVIEGTPLVSAADREPDEGLARGVANAFLINNQRSVEQDAAFGIQQLVDVALKALSPGINDTTTAVACVEHLTSVLARLAGRRTESPYRLDERGELRVIALGPDFESLVNLAYDQIRQNAEGNAMIVNHLLRSIRIVGGQTSSARRRRVLLRHALLVGKLAERSIEEAEDREGIEAAAGELIRFLRPAGG